MVIRQQPLCVFDPHTVMTAAHAAVGGCGWWTLVRRPSRGTVSWIGIRVLGRCGGSRWIWTIREAAGQTFVWAFSPQPQRARADVGNLEITVQNQSLGNNLWWTAKPHSLYLLVQTPDSFPFLWGLVVETKWDTVQHNFDKKSNDIKRPMTTTIVNQRLK